MWNQSKLRSLLQDLLRGKITVDEALSDLCALETENLGFARLDHHRAIRQGFTEVVFCPGKTPEQVAGIFEKLSRRHMRALGTRASREQYIAANQQFPVGQLKYDETARAIWFDLEPAAKREGIVLLAAGTADIPVAEEAAVTIELMGNEAKRIYDVGVSGLHRLLDELPAIQKANVLVVVAGMEGALPSVVGGLVSAPVIAVPTSIGYGTGMGGAAALMGMLNTCANGLAVVNIDNGFGAGCIASRINALAWSDFLDRD